jgi:hypothetical protein
MNSTLDADPPTTVKGTVGRGRLPNAHYPVREYLTTREREGGRLRPAVLPGWAASFLAALPTLGEQVDPVHARLH